MCPVQTIKKTCSIYTSFLLKVQTLLFDYFSYFVALFYKV